MVVSLFFKRIHGAVLGSKSCKAGILSEASRVELGFPHDFLGSQAIQDIVFGGTQDLIDNHHIQQT